MPRYIALLRGINVGGNTMVKMQELRAMFEALNFDRVVSYINSGNIGFDTQETAEKSLAGTIEDAIETQFGRPIDVMVREQEAIVHVLDDNPFKGQFESHKEMHVLFLKAEMPADKRDQLLAAATDAERFAVNGREIYCHLKLGVANTLLGKGFIDKKLKIPVTARNWRTVEKLAEM